MYSTLSVERSFEVSHPVMYSTLFIFTQRPCSRSASFGLISTPSPPLPGDESVVSRKIRFSRQGVPKKHPCVVGRKNLSLYPRQRLSLMGASDELATCFHVLFYHGKRKRPVVFRLWCWYEGQCVAVPAAPLSVEAVVLLHTSAAQTDRRCKRVGGESLAAFLTVSKRNREPNSSIRYNAN